MNDNADEEWITCNGIQNIQNIYLFYYLSFLWVFSIPSGLVNEEFVSISRVQSNDDIFLYRTT